MAYNTTKDIEKIVWTLFQQQKKKKGKKKNKKES